MAILPNLRTLLIPGKSSKEAHSEYQSDMQNLEIWSRQPIQQLVAGSNITLSPSNGQATDSKGNGPHPITISASGGGGGGYASLTGAGTGSTPGDLAQAGGFAVTVQTASTEGFSVVNNSTHQGISLTNSASNAGIQLTDQNSNSVGLNELGGTIAITCQNLAGTAQSSIGMGVITSTSLSDVIIKTQRATGGKSVPAAMEWDLGSVAPIRIFTGTSGTGGQPSYSDSIRAFSFGSDGHIYTSTGSGWSLLV